MPTAQIQTAGSHVLAKRVTQVMDLFPATMLTSAHQQIRTAATRMRNARIHWVATCARADPGIPVVDMCAKTWMSAPQPD